jgi:CBS domain-containing protein
MRFAIVTTLILVALSLVVAGPLGVGCAIYLCEYSKKGSRLVRVTRLATETLAGIPSIIYGLFGALFFGDVLKLGFSVLSGSLTLAIMVLPTIIRTSEEAIRAVPASFREVSYAELKSGYVDLKGKEVKTSSLSSFYNARKVAFELKSWIKGGKFFLTAPAEQLSRGKTARPMRQTLGLPLVKDVMNRNVATIQTGFSVDEAAKKIIQDRFNHLPVVDAGGRLVGIVTAWDVSKAVALSKRDRLDPVMTKNVITVGPDDPVDVAARLLEKHNISALPVIDREKKVIGIVTGEGLSKLLARGSSQ